MSCLKFAIDVSSLPLRPQMAAKKVSIVATGSNDFDPLGAHGKKGGLFDDDDDAAAPAPAPAAPSDAR